MVFYGFPENESLVQGGSGLSPSLESLGGRESGREEGRTLVHHHHHRLSTGRHLAPTSRDGRGPRMRRTDGRDQK